MSIEIAEITPLMVSEIREAAPCKGTRGQQPCKRSAEFYVKVRPHGCDTKWPYEQWVYLVCQRHCAELLDRQRAFGCQGCGDAVTMDKMILDWDSL